MENNRHAPARADGFTPFSARGRIGRGQFLVAYLSVSFTVVLAAVPVLMIPWEAIPATGVFFLALTAARIALTALALLVWALACIKRLHDMGRPGDHFFYLLIPFYVFVLLCRRGEEGCNAYGPGRSGGDLYWSAPLMTALPAVLVLLLTAAHFTLVYALPAQRGAQPAAASAAGLPAAPEDRLRQELAALESELPAADAGGVYADPDGLFLLTPPEGWMKNPDGGVVFSDPTGRAVLMVVTTAAEAAEDYTLYTDGQLMDIGRALDWSNLTDAFFGNASAVTQPALSLSTLGGRRCLLAAFQATDKVSGEVVDIHTRFGVYSGVYYELTTIMGQSCPADTAALLDRAVQSFAVR